ncbi:MAG TPA: hypothetical protein VNI01_05895 [Elusimicrobiota bacterium]|nr:hypothetical protein [Elusimicrobiota bacterium]
MAMRLFLTWTLLLAAIPARADTPWGDRSVGVLVIGAGGGADWQKAVQQARKALGTGFAAEFLVGEIGPRDIQRCLDRLAAARALKIAVVPLELDPKSARLEQIRYMLGINEYPSEEVLKASRVGDRVIPRAKTKLPLVMTPAFGEDAAAADILLDRARALSREPGREAVVLLAEGTGNPEGDERLLKRLSELAPKLREGGGFRSVEPALLSPAPGLVHDRGFSPRLSPSDGKFRRPGDDAGQASVQGALDAIRKAGRFGRALVLPYLLFADGTERAMRKKLDGVFFEWKGKALLPDERAARWVAAQAAKAATAPDMVRFKDAGKALPSAGPKRFVP